jgi:acetate kinase
MTPGDTLLVINAGSSSIKFQLFAVAADDPRRLMKGQFDGIGTHPRLKATTGTGEPVEDRSFAPSEIPDGARALDLLDDWLVARLGGRTPIAIGHRVVHGGPERSGPALVDEAVFGDLERLVPLAPLHQPNNLAAIAAFRRLYPQVPQIACFDTAFHRGHPDVADRFAIPDALYREGVRRYGFHGLSYDYVAGRLRAVDPDVAAGRVVVCHLGSGASMCAIAGGRSMDSTMGFTAVDGLPMGTRTGQLDPGVILYLMQTKGYDAAAVERFLYRDGGLRGLSGISNDMRDLEASAAPGAALAVDYFVYRIVRETGALAAAMGGIDAVVFTAGIGENSRLIRARVVAGLDWLGCRLDPDANARNGPLISTPGGKLKAYVIPTDEELVIARQTLALLGSARPA